MTYQPDPIDTSHIELSPEILALTEELARNVHDHYVRERMAHGWTYGPHRDDEAMHNPTLIPYDQLPESEKEYDRKSAMETVKAIIALGYRIERG